ncbi:hypothetical protein G9464_05870 [Halostella sp. JP-L12]|uniref:hypothetical protein n=1 Tax=Halostella TaxID=1843185 RepID=UPI000EF77F81|nr:MULTISPECIES: hypothetical protein [Halostella]NHN47126.1 hypothetical protein [Halostella sp. JP-L12]
MTLSSCYFCGTAIEQPLSEYPVVPDALGPAPGDQQTVVLCPACHRKLSTVTDHIVAAVDDRQRTLDEASAGGGRGAGDGSAGDESADGGRDGPGDDSPAIDESAAESLLEMGTSRTDSADDASGDGDDGIVVTGPSDRGSGPAGDDAGSAAGADGSAPTDEGSAAGSPTDAGESDESASDSTGEIGEDGPPQATYNRVVRLLQNREFPVERDEIATVAMNAYEIPPEDFDAVIETAVDRGLLEEERGYLKRAE